MYIYSVHCFHALEVLQILEVGSQHIVSNQVMLTKVLVAAERQAVNVCFHDQQTNDRR